MNREIKFRAWDGKRMTIDFCIKSGGDVFQPHYDRPPSLERWDVMQFTGLHDKNGKEIYEGDITQTVCGDGVRLSKFIIEWDEANCRFVKHRHDGEVFDLDSLSVALHEIIGNIYETPSLLKGEQENE